LEIVMYGSQLPSARRSPTMPRRRSMTGRALALVALLIGVVAQDSGRAADDLTDALPYSLGYTVTGDYAVGGVDFVPSSGGNGFQTATLHMGTPAARVVPQRRAAGRRAIPRRAGVVRAHARPGADG
jgi:hypothetical protein